MVSGLALQVHPVVSVLPTEGQTVLIVHVVGFSLMPGGEVPAMKVSQVWRERGLPGVSTRPLPGSLGCK